MSTQCYAPEWRTFQDPQTHVQITQWTSHPAMHHHFYFTNPTVTSDGQCGLFVSYRNGYPNLFTIDLAQGELTQFTNRVDINPFSATVSRQEPMVYFSARQSVWQVDPHTGDESELAHLPESKLGNCSLNRDGSLLAISARYPEHCELVLIDTHDRSAQVLTRRDEIGHIQFSPRNDDLLLFSGSVRQRLWLHNRQTHTDQYLYHQSEREWIVHESWLGGENDEIIFPHWPHALCAIRPDGTGKRTIAAINAWHACSNDEGTWIVADTNHPDRGLLLIDPANGQHEVLCQPQATQRGDQWAYDEPAAGAGIDTSIIRSDNPQNDPPPNPSDPSGVYGPQWSHPHPSFTADGNYVIYTSDREGWSHVYAADMATRR